MTRRCANPLRFVAAVAAASMCLFVATGARADAEGDAKDLFARGRDLRAKGNCAEATVVFKKALVVFPSGLGSLRNLAECEEELHRYASSRRDWLDLKRALVGATDAKYVGWDGDAQAAAVRLAPLIAKLTVDLSATRSGKDVPRAELRDVTVKVNDEIVPLALIGTELERDPGAFVVRADESGGGATATANVTVGQGEAKHVSLRLALVHAPPSSPPVAGGDTAPPPAADPNSGRRLAGYITLGVGVASLIGAGVALAVRQSALGDVDSACPNRAACDPGQQGTLQPTIDRGHTAAALTNVFGAIGIVATGAGVALILTSPSQPPKTGFTLRPAVGRMTGLSAEWSLP